MKIGSFEDVMLKTFGLKVQIAGYDDSYLSDDNDTISQAQKKDVKRIEKKSKSKIYEIC